MRLGRLVPFGSRLGAFYRSHGVTSARDAARWLRGIRVLRPVTMATVLRFRILGMAVWLYGTLKSTASEPVLIFQLSEMGCVFSQVPREWRARLSLIL